MLPTVSKRSEKPTMALSVLPTHPRYLLLEPLGEGGAGVVYKALDRDENRTVALKTLRLPNAVDRRFLEQEIRALSHLHHEGIVEFYDVGLLGAELFFTMEYLEGVTFKSLLGGKAPGSKAIRWLLEATRKVLSALEYVHEQGVLHGDLKPSNLIWVGGSRGAVLSRLSALRESGEIKILDFGLVKSLRAGVGRESAGTPLYMAPEQLEGSPVDERSDLYSLGALLYHLVTGKPPYPTLAASLSRNVEPASPDKLNPACPPDLAKLIRSLLSRLPRQRPATAEAVGGALQRILEPGRIADAAGSPRLLRPVFTGRESQLESLRKLMAQAAAGQGSVVQLIGEGGSGKTWLVEASGLKGEAVLDHGMAFLRGSFCVHGSELHALRSPFRDLIAILGGVESSSVRDALGPWGSTLLDALDPHDSAIARDDPRRGGIPIAASHKSHAPPQVLREQLLGAALRLFRRAVAKQPLFLFLDDLQHASDLDTEFLARLARILASQPILLVVAYRPKAIPPAAHVARWLKELESGPRLSSVVMEDFSDRDMAVFVRAVLSPHGEPSPTLLAALRGRVGGKPSAVHQLLRFLLERDALRLHDGRWTLRGDPDQRMPEVPFQERWQALDSKEQEVLAGALVLGGHCDPGSLVTLLDDPESVQPTPRTILPSLRTLIRAGLLLETSDGYALPSDLEHSLVKSRVARAKVRELHLKAAELLRSEQVTLTGGELLRIARHLDQGGEKDSASRYYREAGRRAGRFFANRPAIQAFRRALELAPTTEEKTLIAQELAELHVRLGETAEGLRLLNDAEEEEARGEAEAVTRSPCAAEVPPRRLALWGRIGMTLQRQGQLDKAEKYFQRCFRESASDPHIRAKACLRLGQVRYDRNDLAGARQFYRKSLDLYGDRAPPEDRAAVYSSLGLVEKKEEQFERAVERFEQALAAAGESGNLLLSAAILNNLGNLHRACGKTARALESLKKSIDARERAGDRHGLAICLNNVARVHFHRGEFGAAGSATERALRIFEEIGDRKGVLIAQSNLGDVRRVLGQLEEAESLLERSMALAERLKATEFFELTRINVARLMLDRSEPERAEELLRLSLKHLPAEQLHDVRCNILTYLAESLMERARLEDAEDALHEAWHLAGESGTAPNRHPELVAMRLRLFLLRGDPVQAVELGKTFLENEPTAVERLGMARFHRELGKAYRELGLEWADRTERHLFFALEELEAMGCPQEVAETLVQLSYYWLLLDEEREASDLRQRAETLFRDLGLDRRLRRLEKLLENP